MSIEDEIASKSESNDSSLTEPATYDLWCGIQTVADSFKQRLEGRGLHFAKASPAKLIVDLRTGFALHSLETLHLRKDYRFVVVTFSACAEYWEDLWDCHPDILLVDSTFEHDFATAIYRASRGEQFRTSPKVKTPLNLTERQILTRIARGRSNREIADELNLQEKTVTNNLIVLYRKLGVRNRTEATLHYWSIWHTFAKETRIPK